MNCDSIRSAVLALGALATCGVAQEWPTWRGPTADGHAAPDADPPVSWSEDQNVRFRVALPGVGTSTPIVVGDRIYLTAAVPNERKVEIAARTSPAPGVGKIPAGTTTGQDLTLLAFDRNTGEERIRQVLADGSPIEKGHKTASYASPSPVTDGERIYASFGSMGIFCTDLDGKPIWNRDLGDMLMANFGEGASPALGGGLLIVPWDHEGPSFLCALDAKTGEQVWRVERESFPAWGTPVITRVGGRALVVATGSGCVHGYELRTGKLVFECDNQSLGPVAGPLIHNGVAYVMNEFRGPIVQALRLEGAAGKLGDSDNLLWEYRRSAPYVPMPVAHEGLLYFLRASTGTLQCLDAATGEPVYKAQRLRLKDVYASLLVAGGRLYVCGREGETVVVRPGREFEILARNQLDLVLDGSPVAVGDRLYLRGRQSLYCVER